MSIQENWSPWIQVSLMVAAIFNFQFINLREEEVCINIFKIFKILKGGGGWGWCYVPETSFHWFQGWNQWKHLIFSTIWKKNMAKTAWLVSIASQDTYNVQVCLCWEMNPTLENVCWKFNIWMAYFTRLFMHQSYNYGLYKVLQVL